MNSTAAYVKLERVIYEYISEANLTDSHYDRLFNIAYRGLEELNLDVYGRIKTRKLFLNENGTVYLPEDCVNWIKIGVLNDKGEVATLRRNTQITKYADTDASRQEVNNDNITSSQGILQNYYLNFFDGINYHNLYGAGGGTQIIGEFDVDETNGLILVRSGFSFDYIIIEYVASIQDETILVPAVCQEALIAWIAWKDIANMPPSRRSNIGLIRTRRQEYYNERNKAKLRMAPSRIQEINDSIRDGFKLAVKA